MSKKLTVSVIIPVFNEEKSIKGCLEHVVGQNSAPEEVILVDNNCTDNTIKIARQFPFVTVIKEKEQGLIPARNKGFAVASGDILARIDADTRLNPNWVRVARNALSEPGVYGVTGPAKSLVEVHFPFVKSTFWSKVYFKFTRESLGFDVLWGPNMAIRRSAYNKIKHNLEKDSRRFHEDQDISILMHKNGLKIKNLRQLTIYVDGFRSADARKILEYEQRRRRTLRAHKKAGNLPSEKRSLKSILTLAALTPLGVLLLLDGLLYTLELVLGLRRSVN